MVSTHYCNTMPEKTTGSAMAFMMLGAVQAAGPF